MTTITWKRGPTEKIHCSQLVDINVSLDRLFGEFSGEGDDEDSSLKETVSAMNAWFSDFQSYGLSYKVLSSTCSQAQIGFWRQRL